MSTGAPPDQFSEDGQNWGFPTYNWDKMAENGYLWWRQRLTQMARYFHAFRIDHVLGFFRIWEIPTDFESGLMGHFNPSVPIHRNDLKWAGIWDVDRLTEPYVKPHLLRNYFPSSEAEHAARSFFDDSHDGRLKFKEAFNTEQKILAHVATLPTDTAAAQEWKTRVERGLLAMLKNVTLMKSPYSSDDFFPRVNMYKTSSFGELPENERQALYKLYVDYYYGARQEEFWAGVGGSRLPVIKNATRMLVCGEDLGMVPKCVEPIMTDLGILGLRVQRMPPDPKQEFGLPWQYSYMTVCTPSSHDTSTIRGWWREDRSKIQWFYNSVLGRHGRAPDECEDWIVEQIVSQHLHSPSMWAIFPIQDFFGFQYDLRVPDPDDEKINEPSNPKHYWRYRMHVTLEHIIEHTAFVSKLRGMIAGSGR